MPHAILPFNINLTEAGSLQWEGSVMSQWITVPLAKPLGVSAVSVPIEENRPHIHQQPQLEVIPWRLHRCACVVATSGVAASAMVLDGRVAATASSRCTVL